LFEELPLGLRQEGFKMYDKIREFINMPLDAKADYHYPTRADLATDKSDVKIVFAKFVLGGLIVASDENFNIFIFNDKCEKLQMLPYGKKVTDACASLNHIFIGILFNKVLILEKKRPFTVVEKVVCEE
jgi:hypothetical protein